MTTEHRSMGSEGLRAGNKPHTHDFIRHAHGGVLHDHHGAPMFGVLAAQPAAEEGAAVTVPDPDTESDDTSVWFGPDCGVNGCGREVGHIGDHRPDPAQPAAGEVTTEADNMCPNCVTPWKCNGPHLSEQTVAAQPAAGEGPWHRRHVTKGITVTTCPHCLAAQPAAGGPAACDFCATLGRLCDLHRQPATGEGLDDKALDKAYRRGYADGRAAEIYERTHGEVPEHG